MSNKDKAMIVALVDLFNQLPAEKQQFFNGYAEGVADMAASAQTADNSKH
ncbi:MAG: hypothetical protein MSB05_00535 [Firmicutes bacterium]|nr:hypothetical protein [Bacillota bacterium]